MRPLVARRAQVYIEHLGIHARREVVGHISWLIVAVCMIVVLLLLSVAVCMIVVLLSGVCSRAFIVKHAVVAMAKVGAMGYGEALRG